MARVTPRYVRDADRQTDKSAITKIETLFCKLSIQDVQTSRQGFFGLPPLAEFSADSARSFADLTTGLNGTGAKSSVQLAVVRKEGRAGVYRKKLGRQDSFRHHYRARRERRASFSCSLLCSDESGGERPTPNDVADTSERAYHVNIAQDLWKSNKQ